MDYQRHTVEDFVLDPHFRKWVIAPDNETNLFWDNWVKEHPEKIKDLKEAKKIINRLTEKDSGLEEQEVDNLWQNIDHAITYEAGLNLPKQKIVPLNPKALLEVDYPVEKVKNISYLTISKIAASIILIFCLGISFYLAKEDTLEANPPTLVKKETSWGQKFSVFLSDGTEVRLNSGSSLEYYQDFSENEREVFLNGEAFFNVAIDEKRPFKVISREIVTEALGTSFNVQAYDDQVKVALVTGKVSVDKLGEDHEINTMVLSPGEEASYQPEFGFKRSTFDINKVLAWKEGIIYFKNAGESEVFDALERWYGIKINKSNTTSKKWDYTASFNNQSLEYVLMSIGFAMDFDFTIKDKSIELKYKN